MSFFSSVSPSNAKKLIVFHRDKRGNIREVGEVSQYGAYLTHGGHGSWVGDSVEDVIAAARGECGLE